MTSESKKSSATSEWENEGGATRPLAGKPEIPETLAAHGITAVQLTVYEWSGYRYTNARDAIAAAERHAR